MALIDKNMKAIEADPELQAKLKELWNRDAPVSDFYDALTDAGIDVTLENLEDTHAELQRKRGEAIAAMEKVDSDQLAKVAGGNSTGSGGCTENYYIEDCAATVETGSWCGSNDWCALYSVGYMCASVDVNP